MTTSSNEISNVHINEAFQDATRALEIGEYSEHAAKTAIAQTVANIHELCHLNFTDQVDKSIANDNRAYLVNMRLGSASKITTVTVSHRDGIPRGTNIEQGAERVELLDNGDFAYTINTGDVILVVATGTLNQQGLGEKIEGQKYTVQKVHEGEKVREIRRYDASGEDAEKSYRALTQVIKTITS